MTLSGRDSGEVRGSEPTEPISAASVRRLINEVLARYGSIEAFCDYLRGLLDAPTDQLPAPALTSPLTAGRHRRRGPA
ncbi:hypothetical protein [Nocardia sp. JMUB6875]|uniref:hypothetical protein n=1 Tax=Nocardia sp. JMUB6875 TaxID=3158170 RepID=UPI0034E8BBE1